MLVHGGTKYSFQFGLPTASMMGHSLLEYSCRPGPDQGPFHRGYADGFEERWTAFAGWAQRMKEELSAPDLWAQMEAYSLALPSGDDAADATPLVQEERQRIERAIAVVRDNVAKLEALSVEQLQLINEKLDYLVDASDRFTRKDWLLLATGQIMNLATTVGMQVDTYKHVFQPLIILITSGFQQLLA